VFRLKSADGLADYLLIICPFNSLCANTTHKYMPPYRTIPLVVIISVNNRHVFPVKERQDKQIKRCNTTSGTTV